MDVADQSAEVEGRLQSRIAELEAALEDTEARLRDVDHRARNDLQLVWSVVLMQMRRTPDGPARAALKRAADRVGAVCAALKHLPRPGEPAEIDAQALIRDLVGEIAAAAGRPDVRLKLELDPIRVPPRQAAPISLIVEELVQNALGHAFQGRGGRIEVSLHETGGGAVLAIVDDGVGAPGGPSREGFGISLVELLCRQLKGELAIAAGPPGGIRAVVRMPEAN